MAGIFDIELHDGETTNQDESDEDAIDNVVSAYAETDANVCAHIKRKRTWWWLCALPQRARTTRYSRLRSRGARGVAFRSLTSSALFQVDYDTAPNVDAMLE